MGKAMSKEKIKPAGYIQSAEVVPGKGGSVSLTMNTKQVLLFYLTTFLMAKNIPDGVRAEIASTKDFLDEHLENFDIRPGEANGTARVSFSAPPELEPEIMKRLQYYYVSFAIAKLLGQEKEFFRVNDIPERKRRELKRLGKKTPATGGGPYKVSKHVINQTVKLQDGQMNLFDTLTEEVKGKVLRYGQSVEWINQKGEGIKLTASEYKVVDCLMKLIHDKSGGNPKNPGNAPEEMRKYADGTTAIAPGIRVTLYELAREYNGGQKNPSGKEMETVGGVLNGLASDPNKMALIRYERKTKSADGRRVITDRVETFAHLVQIEKFSREITEGEQVINYREEIVVRLHPVFADQIEDNWVLMPGDVIARMNEANGGPKLPAASYRLRDILAREIGSNRQKYQIGKGKLLELLAPDFVREHRMKRAEEALESAISICSGIGLIQSHEVQRDQTGRPKYVFNLNKDWAKARTGLRTSVQ